MGITRAEAEAIKNILERFSNLTQANIFLALAMGAFDREGLSAEALEELLLQCVEVYKASERNKKLKAKKNQLKI